MNKHWHDMSFDEKATRVSIIVFTTILFCWISYEIVSFNVFTDTIIKG